MDDDKTQPDVPEKTSASHREELLYKLVGQNCTMEAIQNLLREFKLGNSKEVRIGADKSDAVDNLRRAVGANYVPKSRLYDLLRDAEESGSQHIFFYRPLAAATRYANAAAVGPMIGGDNWENVQYRLDETPPLKPILADFRKTEYGWVAKWYIRRVKREYLGDPVQEGVDPDDSLPIFVQRYKKGFVRVALVMRWNRIGVLEVRVPRWSSRDGIVHMREQTWKLAKKAFRPQEFQEWNLHPMATRMLREYERHSADYDVGDTLIRDSGRGTLRLTMQTEFDDLFACVERRKAVDAYLSVKKNVTEELIVKFKATKSHSAMPADLRVVIGAHDPNEVLIAAKTIPASIDHVVYRLQQFAKQP